MTVHFVTGRIYSNQSQCNGLRNKKFFAPFLKPTSPGNVQTRYLGLSKHQQRLEKK